MDYSEYAKIFMISQFTNGSIKDNHYIVIMMLLFFMVYKNNDIRDIYYKICNTIYISNKISYEGTKTSITNWNGPLTTSNYSDEFVALFEYILNNCCYDTNYINELEYMYSNVVQKSDEMNINGFDNDGIYIITQKHPFVINKHINGFVEIKETTSDNTKNQSSCIMHKTIVITISSYTYDIGKLKNFVNNLCDDYQKKMIQKRNNKKYVYRLISNNYEEEVYDCWKETSFESSRTFKNIFFNDKEKTIKKIDFFLNNKQWYYDKGIPYTLGIGLHGNPGTGKTSFIKALANYTNRHIITLSFKTIKKIKHLDTFFYEKVYCHNNKKNPIGFDKKIIVFEDIDCADEIVFSREAKKDVKTQNVIKKTQITENDIENDCNDILEGNKHGKVKFTPSNDNKVKNDDDKITLDDILNVFDGICETPGRIMIITSNHYDKLDPALIRPGRIDITMEMQMISKSSLSEFFKFYYEKPIDDTILSKYSENKTPAEITNYFIQSNNDETIFYNLLQC